MTFSITEFASCASALNTNIHLLCIARAYHMLNDARKLTRSLFKSRFRYLGGLIIYGLEWRYMLFR